MDSLIGSTILGYNVKEEIGSGGFGRVYSVQKKNIVGTVTRALKVITLPQEAQYMEVLNSMGGDREKANKYFRTELEHVVNEIRVFSLISEKDNHNIVSYYESDIEKNGKFKYNIYILMEYLKPLDKWLNENNLTVEQGIDIGIGVANALKICHSNKIIHRDIKLNNVFVSKDGNFKLGDFGVSKKLDAITRVKTIKGTPQYIAPEVYLGNSKYDNTVDIYSLGILLYYLFNKRRYPFFPLYPLEYSSDDESRAFYNRMNYDVPDAPVCAPDELARIILKAIEKPEKRYKNADEIIEELQNAKANVSQSELEKKIGFEPIAPRTVVDNTKENELVENLDTMRGNSISFGEYTIETISKKKEPVLISRKKLAGFIIGTIVTIGLAIGVLYGLGSGKNENVAVTTALQTSAETTIQETSEQITTRVETTTKKKKKKKKKTIETTVAETKAPETKAVVPDKPKETAASKPEKKPGSEFGFQGID